MLGLKELIVSGSGLERGSSSDAHARVGCTAAHGFHSGPSSLGGGYCPRRVAQDVVEALFMAFFARRMSIPRPTLSPSLFFPCPVFAPMRFDSAIRREIHRGTATSAGRRFGHPSAWRPFFICAALTAGGLGCIFGGAARARDGRPTGWPFPSAVIGHKSTGCDRWSSGLGVTRVARAAVRFTVNATPVFCYDV